MLTKYRQNRLKFITDMYIFLLCFFKCRDIMFIRRYFVRIRRKKTLMTADWEKELIVRTAWYYYIRKKTQKEIADMLSVSRMRVIRLLEKAEQENVVQITIHTNFRGRLEAEQALIDSYGLADALVIPSDEMYTSASLNDAIARAAAMYINEHFSDNPIINIGYGDTTGRFMNYFSQISKKKPTYVSLTGGVSIYLLNTQSSAVNASLYLIPAPLAASTPEIVEAIKKESAVIEIARMHATASCSVIGIGGVDDNATVIKSGIIQKSDFDFLKMCGAAGDVLAHFFDENGNFITSAADEHLVTYPPESLKKLHNVIAVAAGSAKYVAIRAALRAHYPDILITDEDTARWLVKNI